MFDRHQAAECIKVYADRAIKAAEQEDWNNYILEVMNALRATHTALHLHLNNPENITTQTGD